jgi:predicted Fe-S protein YdhL (DUF1289 family)
MFRVAVLLGASHLLAAPLPAQPATNHLASASADSTPARSLLSRPPAPPAPAPSLPSFRSPISFFRELLAMNAAERKQALTNRPPEIQKQILAKVREYESLPPDERELRLRVTELRWYLLPLMTAPATNRPARLGAIPEQDRKLVEDRLQEWDKLPSDVQKELLANQATISYLADLEGRTTEQRRQMLDNIPPARREMLEQGINKWSAMSEDGRRKMLDRFRAFFDLTAQEKQKALSTLSGPERRQSEKMLRTFGSLPPDQRDQCIRSFAKFASLSLAERQQFLKSAERWKLMSPAERQVWRELVHRLPPPLPPGVPFQPSGAPPLPPSFRPPRPAPSVATNRN